jgi:hypothetical protein
MLSCVSLLLGPRLLSSTPGFRSLESPQEWWSKVRICGDGVEEDREWMKMMAKKELPTLGCWSKYIREGSARLEGNHTIKSLSSLHCFLKKDHMARIQVHTGRTPFFSMANDFCQC